MYMHGPRDEDDTRNSNLLYRTNHALRFVRYSFREQGLYQGVFRVSLGCFTGISLPDSSTYETLMAMAPHFSEEQ